VALSREEGIVFNTVIVPLDGSELSEAAIPAAAEIAAKFGSKLIILRTVESTANRIAMTPGVLDAPAAASTNVELLQEVTEQEEKEAGSYLAQVQAKLGNNVETIVAEGHPADQIIALAEERKADLIVMSTHGRGGLGRLIHGSIADAVIKHQGIPVLLMRPPAEHKA